GKKNGSAVVICPGGGYAVACIDKEGHDTARWLNSLGITAVVLTYRCGPCARNGAPRADVQEAIRLTREKADEWGIRKDRIGVLGYSAGGHLASTAATHFTSNEGGNRPDFAILVYPVITMSRSTHGGSKRNLLGNDPSEELQNEFSNELRVNDHTPPTFLAHAVDDNGVLVENSLLFYRAMKKHKRPVALAIYESGGHGFGLGVKKSDAQKWPARCAAWLKEQGLLEK
ncbi:MAG: alpha/beta hydrolase, partial [Planctomycetota bacterium]